MNYKLYTLNYPNHPLWLPQYIKTIIAYIIIYGLYYYYILCVYEMKIRVGKRERLWIKRNIRLFTIYFG